MRVTANDIKTIYVLHPGFVVTTDNVRRYVGIKELRKLYNIENSRGIKLSALESLQEQIVDRLHIYNLVHLFPRPSGDYTSCL